MLWPKKVHGPLPSIGSWHNPFREVLPREKGVNGALPPLGANPSFGIRLEFAVCNPKTTKLITSWRNMMILH
jgi:hypothetical protein